MNRKDDEIIIVLLRQPEKRPNEKRSDPFWEFGSFGCTRCHYSNLMNPNKSDQLVGKRFAFAQGGNEGFKLIYLTPPIKILKHDGFVEAKWHPTSMPFKYSTAPLIINNFEDTQFPTIKNEIAKVRRRTWMGKFASAYRSRKKPVSSKIKNEIVSVYDQSMNIKGSALFAQRYEEALPFAPPLIDRNRKSTYRSFLNYSKETCKEKAEKTVAFKSSCSKK